MIDVDPIFLRVAREDIVYIKFLVESYEGIGIVRTLDRHAAIIVVLAPPDAAATARALIGEIGATIPCREIPWPPEASDDWLLRAAVDGDAETSR
jgi:hypothetical protein